MTTGPIKSWEELEHLVEQKTHLWYSVLAERPGACLLVVAIEHCLYPPNSPRNTLFHMGFLEYANIAFVVFGIPRGARAEVEKYISACGLQSQLGVLTIIDAQGTQQLPLQSKLCRSLEFQRNHPIYTNPSLNKTLHEKQWDLIIRIMEQDWRPSAEELARVFDFTNVPE